MADTESDLLARIRVHGAVPRHIAIIMDGNGRWAKARRLPRLAGHKAGVEAVRRVTRAGRAAVGWASNAAHVSWVSLLGLGDVTSTWAFAVANGRHGLQCGSGGKWGAAAQGNLPTPPAPGSGVARRWVYGDVLGLCVDVEGAVASLYVNGVAEPGLALPLAGFGLGSSWLMPSLSLHSDFTGVVNVGGSGCPLAYPVPGFDPVGDAL